ncbi:hypothetical protein Sj15T_00310 [Sphingobium sp. TA15]|uniref:Uncharacterized protein n=1 Tax=Sphingobium indicum (strain DSM 16413 / CCM 7287 / MTCC 6362 / UT26 / NBRC 101211 / UT26S) TaxID=452662 RepID=D4YZA5_SPHIU|nr:hypothetical protein [Sphingobium indicum]BAI95687.1 hypothetical protein SJA_C1-08530 [Sphingobium indicum UT26S]BDD65010.1 hypothetical protein Sj15T_00310 [Sphingobium sp. TA15]
MSITINQANDFHTARGNTAWTGDDSIKQAAINKADDYILAYYAPFKSDVQTTDARYIAAYALLALEFLADAPTLKSSQTIKSKEVKSGGQSIKTEYQDADIDPSDDPYPLITAMLAPLRANSGGNTITFSTGVII